MDCGVEVMKQRISETTFPWLISNIWESPLPDSNSKGMHSSTKRVPFAGLKSMHTISRGGVKFGFMGLASWEWVSNIGERVLPLIEYIDYVQACNQFASKLRKEENCDFIIALTHMRCIEDENLAKQALDIDIILGGHDHILWKEFINGRWIVKSGTDFRVRCPNAHFSFVSKSSVRYSYTNSINAMNFFLYSELLYYKLAY